MGSASRSLSGNQANKVVFNGSPSDYAGPPVSRAWPYYLQEKPPLSFKDMQVLWQVLWCVAGMGKVDDGVGVLVSLFSGAVLLLVVLHRCFLDPRLI